jgi:hypothetical protein
MVKPAALTSGATPSPTGKASVSRYKPSRALFRSGCEGLVAEKPAKSGHPKPVKKKPKPKEK